MRTFILLLTLCGTACGLSLVSTLDQLPQVVQGMPGGGTCVFHNNVASGDTLIIGANSEGALTTPTDTRTTTWTLVDSDTTTTIKTYTWIGVAGSSGAETITLHGTVSFPKSVCLELPASIGSTVDVHTHGVVTNSGNAGTTSSITTSVDGAFIFCYLGGGASNGRIVPNVPYIPFEGNGADNFGAGYGFAGQNGSYTCPYKSTINATNEYVFFALKPAAITIDTAALPSASTTGAYTYCLQARGGTGAYTWSISSGALPSGLSINSSTGCVSGTVTGGTTTPTFQVTDGTTTATKSLALTVNGSAAAASIVQAIAGTSASFTSVGVGDCLAVVEFGVVANGFFAPTDGLGTVFKFVNGSFYTATGGTSMSPVFLFVGQATSSGSDLIAFSGGFLAAQFTSCQAFADVVSLAGGTNSGVATLTGGSLTTLAPNSIIWAAVSGSGSNSAWNAGTGYTNDGNNTGTTTKMQGEHQSIASTGSNAVTFSQTANTDGNWGLTAIAFRPSTSGSVTTNHRRAWVACR